MYSKRLTLVNRDVLRRIVMGSVDRAVDVAQEGNLIDTLVAELARSLRREGRAIRGLTRRQFLEELERSNHELLQLRRQAESELSNLQAELMLHRRMLDDAHAAMVARADADAPIFDAKVRDDLARLFDRAEAGELTLQELRAEVDALVLASSSEGRDRMLDAWAVERDRQVDLLRRRINKLNRSLEASEEALQRLSSQAEEDPGIASIYRTVQGLEMTANHLARKRVMLAEIYRANLRLREQFTHGGLPSASG
jgi:hypothetical protein